jgi:hypothetical protein
VRAVLDGEATRVRTARPGARNVALFTAALHLGQLVAAGLLDERQATSHLHAASTSHVGIEGFSAAEALRAITNGLRYGQRRPRRSSPSERGGSPE